MPTAKSVSVRPRGRRRCTRVSTSRHGSTGKRCRSSGSRWGLGAWLRHRRCSASSGHELGRGRRRRRRRRPRSSASRAGAAVDADHQAEAAGRARRRRRRRRPRRPRRARRRDAEPLGGAQEHVGRRLAGDAARRRRPRRRRRRSKRSASPAASSTAGALRDDDTTRQRARPASRGGRAARPSRGTASMPSRSQDLVEDVVLAVAQRRRPSSRRAGRRRLALGQLDAARGEEVADAVVARLAVDVGEVVGSVYGSSPPAERRPRKSLNISAQARMCTSAVGVTTPSRSNSDGVVVRPGHGRCGTGRRELGTRQAYAPRACVRCSRRVSRRGSRRGSRRVSLRGRPRAPARRSASPTRRAPRRRPRRGRRGPATIQVWVAQRRRAGAPHSAVPVLAPRSPPEGPGARPTPR